MNDAIDRAPESDDSVEAGDFVELGAVSEETKGQPLGNRSDGGSFTYFWW